MLPTECPSGKAVIDAGRKLAKDWQLERNLFLEHFHVVSEAAYKREAMSQGRVMQHAQVGFRDIDKTKRAWLEIYETCLKKGVHVDRYGICLDWTMGLPEGLRQKKWRGTGLILEGPDEFASLSSLAPVAPHFGDFVLGFPAALENTKAALVAGATSIGNLGQYFTFRLPGFDDDVVTTTVTLKALGLIAAQDTEILVHSNLDDGFAAMFTDLSSSLGAVLLEKYIVEDLVGARISHCYGHHFSDPLRRLAFHFAMNRVTDTPGTMIYGNTTSYRGDAAENFAALASYLSADVEGQVLKPSGHAVNPVPVSENRRIPDIEEIIDAQLFAGRMIELREGKTGFSDLESINAVVEKLIQEGEAFFTRALAGFQNAGVDVEDPFCMLLALRRLGGRQLETLFGSEEPVVKASLVDETESMAKRHLGSVSDENKAMLKAGNMSVMVAATDVHEHGKLLLETVLADLGVHVIDGGVSCDPVKLVEQAIIDRPDALAISTYNGIALTFIDDLTSAMEQKNMVMPILVGGRLNQVPTGSNTSLPVDVADKLGGDNVTVCRQIEDAVPALLKIMEGKT